ncbi:late control protein D [Vibrio fluvialis]|nr:late control protein D [Vibrio fluvialis]
MELMTYQPQFKILANGNDITAAIEQSFSELTITDVSGEKADTLSIKLDGTKIGKLPTKKAALQVSLGFNGKLYKQGTFYVNDIGESGFPDVVTITATSIPLGGKDLGISIQTQRTQSWDEITIADLLKTVAARNKLKDIVNEELGAIVIEHLDQTSESDMALMTRLARQYGAVSKVSDENWLFLKIGEGKNASGTKTLPVHTIYKSSCSRYQYKSNSRTESSSAIAKWHNPETGETGVVSSGTGDPAFQILYQYPTEKEAQAAADAKAKTLTDGSDTFSFSTEATHQLVKAFAEGHVKLQGWRSEISDRNWCIKQITKKLAPSSGLAIDISCDSAA